MAKLHKETGMKFIIGVPLNGNRPEFVFAMVAKARDFLPEAAILGFELGNEPAYWDCPGMVSQLYIAVSFGSAKQCHTARCSCASWC